MVNSIIKHPKTHPQSSSGYLRVTTKNCPPRHVYLYPCPPQPLLVSHTRAPPNLPRQTTSQPIPSSNANTHGHNYIKTNLSQTAMTRVSAYTSALVAFVAGTSFLLLLQMTKQRLTGGFSSFPQRRL